MLLLLIRHGETVDNVAGLYAGVTDSKLTNQGVLQTSRLATHLWTRYGGLTHVFTSDLQRAARTGQAIVDHQNSQLQASTSEPAGGQASALPHSETPKSSGLSPLTPFQLPVLREQDFGSLERQSWSSSVRAPPPAGSNSSSSGNSGANGSGNAFIAPETKATMEVRADEFISDYLLPLLVSDHDEGEQENENAKKGFNPTLTREHPQLKVAVVSHGMLLSRLWKRLLSRCASWSRDVKLTPEAQASVGPRGLEHLGGWSNTGFLTLDVNFADNLSAYSHLHTSKEELVASPASLNPRTNDQGTPAKMSGKPAPTEPDQDTEATTVTAPASSTQGIVQAPITPHQAAPANPSSSSSSPAKTHTKPESPDLLSLTITVHAVNVTDHLRGLKRTRGGVGSAAHDDSQKSIHSFFKRRKAD